MAKNCSTCGSSPTPQPEAQIMVHNEIINAIKIENLTIREGTVVVSVKEPTVKISFDDIK